MKQALLKGDGTNKCPYWVQGFRNQEFRQLKEVLELCDREGISRLNVAFSGRYFERREDGWYETSDTETCNRVYSLPPQGRKVE